MLDAVVFALIVAVFVVTLFGIVQWLLSFFPVLKSERLNSPVGGGLLLFILIESCFERAKRLMNHTDLSHWTLSEYRDLLFVCVIGYCVILTFNLWKPANKTPVDSVHP